MLSHKIGVACVRGERTFILQLFISNKVLENQIDMSIKGRWYPGGTHTFTSLNETFANHRILRDSATSAITHLKLATRAFYAITFNMM